ncbi:hypothetical protein CMALT394_360012 [Carnobacterium maltaromaticum]|nr:hypothetical protein CMALT394_360012 [Carnobacterium maltaromaticum]
MDALYQSQPVKLQVIRTIYLVRHVSGKRKRIKYIFFQAPL